ncbi:casein kinase II, regulatory subunit [Zopfochytrium polystomum]|nr:casein kinase II, regulatory subunit [Zopfochytrium polystomum]
MSGSESAESSVYWVDWFLSQRGNEFFCEVDDEYIQDRFNLTGLNTEVPHYNEAYELLTEPVDPSTFDNLTYPNPTLGKPSFTGPNRASASAPFSSSSPSPSHNAQQADAASHRTEVDSAARHLYGLIHARYVITTRGQLKMFEKVRHAEFGRCPRVLCHNQPVLPVGLSDIPGVRNVMLYCPRCEDVYSPPSRRHAFVDGAYFGTTFPHLLIQVYPQLAPARSPDRYVPKIFGFKVHSIANEMRKQDEIREAQAKRLALPPSEESA